MAKRKTAKMATKKAAAPSPQKKPVAGKKAARPAAKKAAAALARTRHQRSRIGLSRKADVPRFITGQRNTFTVFGDRIGTGNPNNKRVYLDATNHTWVNPPAADVQNSGRDALRITAVCDVRNPARHGLDPDDDLTVTIVLDEGTGNEDTTECNFDDVLYDA